ncbi:MAG: oligosaccharide flippase family protein [Ferruginibacter sp.]|nr:oligosaccharide flippase family protein [Ferruginibacter sp.]
MKQYITNLKGNATKHKSLIQNFSFLSALFAFNILIPLISYPYLIRILGKEIYGLVVFSQSAINYLAILVSFGFNISATKEISIHRNNKQKLSEIVSSVLLIKCYLFLLSWALLALLIFLIPQTRGHETIFMLSMTACLNEVLFPVWYFQGIEQMKYLTYITVISRSIFLLLIFLIIHAPQDYLYVPIIYGIGYLIAGVIALFIIFFKHGIRFSFQPIRTLRYYFKDSIPIFISNLSTNLYSSTNKVIIGTYMGMGEVAYYDLAEKLTSLMKIPQAIFNQSILPKISKDKNIHFVKQMFKISLALNIFLLIILVIFSKVVILLLGGEDMLPAQLVISILALTLPIIAMSNTFGIQILLPFGYNKVFSKIIVAAALVYLLQLILIWICFGFSIINISLVTLSTEIITAGYLYYFCKKNKLWV